MNKTKITSQKAVTLTDIARELDLSVATVSKALNNDPLIRESTRKRVKQASIRKGYVPDQYGRTLRTQRSMRLGIILPTLKNPFFVEKVAMAQETAWQAGYELTFACSEWDIEREISCCERLLGMRVAGIVVADHASFEYLEHFNTLLARGIPIVDLTTKSAVVPGASSLIVDRILGMELITEHLLELGHRSFGLVGYKLRNSPSLSHQLRWQGVLNAIRKAGLEEDCLEIVPTSDDSLEAGYDGVDFRIRSGIDLPGAFLALNDDIARGALIALKDHQITVPERVSVAGFDNTVTSRFTRPALTTVSQTHLNLGRRAIEMLLEQIADPKQPSRHLNLEPKLVIRDSTGQAVAERN